MKFTFIFSILYILYGIDYYKWNLSKCWASSNSEFWDGKNFICNIL